MVDINYWAVLVSGIVANVVGFLWYGPLFGKKWSEEMGWGTMTPEVMKEKQKQATPGYMANVVFAVLTAYVFAYILWAFESVTIGDALQGVFFMWIGFMLPLHAGKKFWMGKSWSVVVIDAGYSLVSLIVTGIILQLWK